jgi:hypothetical protein
VAKSFVAAGFATHWSTILNPPAKDANPAVRRLYDDI